MTLKASKPVAIALSILLLCVLGRLTHLFPFAPSSTRWSLEEDYTHGGIPKTGSVQQFRSVRSNLGILIGADGPGFVEWRFARPGPFPTIIQPFFIPAQHQLGQITLRTPGHPAPILLSRDLPLRHRAMDISSALRHEKAYALRFEGTGAMLEGIRFFEPSETPPVPWVVVLIVLFVTGLVLWSGNYSALIILALSLLGFFLRWKVFQTYYSLPLKGDPVEYWTLAQIFQWRHPLLTNYREPGFIWMVYAARRLFGDSIRSLTFLGVLLSTSWIPLTAELAAAAGWPLWVGIGAAAMVATNSFSIFMCVQGYQLEFFTLLILLFSIAWLKNCSWAMGFMGGLLCITRVQSFIAVIPLAGIADWKHRWSQRQRLGFWGSFLLLTVPYLRAVRKETGSFFGHVNLYVRDAWMHRQGTALIKGYVTILLNPRDSYNRIFLNSHDARAWNLLFLPFFWLGLMDCFRNPKDRWFLWLPLFFLSGLPMLHDVLREPRLLFHVQPFAAILTFRGVLFLVRSRQEKRLAFLNP